MENVAIRLGRMDAQREGIWYADFDDTGKLLNFVHPVEQLPQRVICPCCGQEGYKVIFEKLPVDIPQSVCIYAIGHDKQGFIHEDK